MRVNAGGGTISLGIKTTMGIENRDYVRGGGGGTGGSYGGYAAAGDYWAVKFLLIANIAVFILQNVWVGGANFHQPAGVVTQYLQLSLTDIQNFQLWRFVTYGFCHGSLMHIFFNMFVLWMFGRLVEPIYGSREFLAFYLTGVVFSGLCFIVIQRFNGGLNPVIGASGGVNSVVFLCAMIYPRMTVLFMFVIPVEFRFLAIGYALIDLFGAINPQQGSVIAHSAHLGGAAFGVAYKYFGWRIMPLLQFRRRNWKLPKRRPKPNPEIRAYRPPEENLESRVDEILVKIQQQGEQSLTDEERQVLTDASQRYKDRK